MKSAKSLIDFLIGMVAALALTVLLSLIDGRYEHSMLFFLMAIWVGAIILYLCLPPVKRETERRKLSDVSTRIIMFQAHAELAGEAARKLCELVKANSKVYRAFGEPFIGKNETESDYEKRKRLYINSYVPGSNNSDNRNR